MPSHTWHLCRSLKPPFARPFYLCMAVLTVKSGSQQFLCFLRAQGRLSRWRLCRKMTRWVWVPASASLHRHHRPSVSLSACTSLALMSLAFHAGFTPGSQVIRTFTVPHSIGQLISARVQLHCDSGSSQDGWYLKEACTRGFLPGPLADGLSADASAALARFACGGRLPMSGPHSPSLAGLGAVTLGGRRFRWSTR